MENQQNNNRDRKSVNTRSYRLANIKSAKPAALEISFWDELLKLAFMPELPQSQQTEQKRFDDKAAWITCLTRAKCNELINAYNEKIVPALLGKEQKRISVPIAEVNQLAIDTNIVEGVAHPLLVLIKNIDRESLTSEDAIYYEFNNGEFIEDYNPENGSFSGRSVSPNELDLFIKDLTNFRDAMSKSYVHAARCVDKTFKDGLNTSLQKIGEKVGADMGFQAGYNKSGYGYGNIFDRPTGAASGTPANQDTVTSLEDIDALFKQ